MQIKNTHWVYQSIMDWSKFSENRSSLIKILNQDLDTFYFLRGQISEDDVHAYLGFYKNQLFIHFIPSSVDCLESFFDEQQIPKEIYSCLACKEIPQLGDPIETEDGLKRIANWRNPEIRNKVIESSIFYNAFFIPNNNFQSNMPLKVNFAIKEDVNSNELQVDLVLSNLDGRQDFLDTCRPVPPFKYDQESSFALLLYVKKLGKPQE